MKTFLASFLSSLTCGLIGNHKRGAQTKGDNPTYAYQRMAEIKEPRPQPAAPKYDLRAPSMDGTEDWAIIYG